MRWPPSIDLGSSAYDEDDNFDCFPVPAIPDQGHSDPPRAGGDEPGPDDCVAQQL